MTHVTSNAEISINSYIRPETELEKLIVSDPDWVAGAIWGEPRWGHPEGKVLYHIRHVLDNVDKAAPAGSSDELMRQRLRLVAIIHDSFKYLEDNTKPRKPNKHHAVIAYRFAKKYITDNVVLDAILLHDNAYYAWVALQYHRPDISTMMMRPVQERLGEHMQLYYLFYKCDTRTGDKTQAPLAWFEQEIKGIEVVDF